MPQELKRSFDGIMPRRSPKLLPETCAQTALNCRLLSGRLEPLNAVTYPNMDDGKDPRVASADFYSITVPSAPTVAAANIFDASSVVCNAIIGAHNETQRWHYGTQTLPQEGDVPVGTSFEMELVGYVEEEDELVLTYLWEGLEWTFADFLYGAYHMLIYYQFTLPDGTVIPNVYTDRTALFSETHTLASGGIDYGTWQIVNQSFEAVAWEWGSQIDMDIKSRPRYVNFRIRMNYFDKTTRIRRYVQASVIDRAANEVSHEGPPSDLSDQVIIRPGQYVVVTGSANHRLYRTDVLRPKREDFGWVADMTASSYADKQLDAELGDPPPPFGNPPDDMTVAKSIVTANGYAVAWFGKELWFSDVDRHIPFWREDDRYSSADLQGLTHMQNRHYAWPNIYTMYFESDITDVMTSGHNLIVFTDDGVFLVSGQDPRYMTRSLIEGGGVALSANGTIHVDGIVYYVVAEGIRAISGGSSVLVSDQFYTIDEWSPLNPSTMVAREYDNKLFLFTNGSTTAGLRYNPKGELSSFCTFTTLSGGTLTWKSREIEALRDITFAVGRIRAETLLGAETGFSVTLNVYANGSLVFTKVATTPAPFKLETGGTKLSANDTWEYQVSAAHPIDEVLLVERSVSPIQNNGIRIVRTEDDIATWLSRKVTFPRYGAFTVLSVNADSYPITVTLAVAGTVVYSTSVTNNRPVKIVPSVTYPNALNAAEEWEIDVIGDTSEIDEVLLVGRQRTNLNRFVVDVKRRSEPFSWLAQQFTFPKPVRPNVARIRARTYPVTLRLYRNESTTESWSRAVADGDLFRIPQLRVGKTWEFDAESNDEIYQVEIASSNRSLVR